MKCKLANIRAISLLLLLLCLSLVFSFSSCEYGKAQTNPQESYAEDTVFSDVTLETVTQDTDENSEPLSSSAESDTKEPTDIHDFAVRAREILAGMTAEEKVGQLFLCRNPRGDGEETIQKYHPGGIIFFARDFKGETPDTFRALIDSYNSRTKVGLLTAVDEEGGSVNRVSLYTAFRAAPFDSPAELYSRGGIDEILRDCEEKSKLLLSIGLNFNLSPVVDVAQDKDAFIYDRTIGADAQKTAEYASAVIGKMREMGIMAALKHFPGYGENEDTHTGIAIDNRTLEELASADLLPFEAGIKAGTPAVLVSHNIVNCIDERMPASLSPRVVELLREKLAFDGVIVTDDLSMGAIKKYTDGASAAVSAILAGCDLLCCSDVEEQYPAVLRAFREGIISEERINESVFRLLMMKLEYGVID